MWDTLKKAFYVAPKSSWNNDRKGDIIKNIGLAMAIGVCILDLGLFAVYILKELYQ